MNSSKSVRLTPTTVTILYYKKTEAIFIKTKCNKKLYYNEKLSYSTFFSGNLNKVAIYSVAAIPYTERDG